MNNLIFWMPRLIFGLLLLVCGELLAWRDTHTYTVLEWLWIAPVYPALAAIALDLIVRFRVQTWPGVMLVAGLYGISRNAIIAGQIFDDVPASIVLYATGIETLTFLVALAGLWLLYHGTFTRQYLLMIIGGALLTGVIAGVWTRWYPEIDTVQRSVPELTMVLTLTAGGFIAIVVLAIFLPFPRKITATADWKLTPLEWVPVLIYPVLVASERISSLETFNPLGALIAGTAFTGLLIVLWYYSTQNPEDHSRLFIQELRSPTWMIPILASGIVLIGLLAGYELLPAEGSDPLQSQIVFVGIAAFGVLWIPVVSTWTGFQAVIQLATEEY